ncbi:MAG: hypothetical protein EPN92_07870 [Chitinophagaceae bacterium]|nr:MAG: hypothetical protein EPN92_07870 [Chitinophagaceae bacterium]
MKKTIFILFLMTTAGFSFAQMPDKFVKAMEAKVPAVDTTHSIDGLTELANSFERIADAEKNQWLAYYYAALCNVDAGLMMGGGDIMAGNPDKTDPIADKAEKLLNKAEELSKDNSEIFIVKKMIATLRMMGDPMNRYMTYGPEATAALEKAKSLNPDNPRAYILEGQDKFYTPEQYGGSKAEAKVLFETAMKKFETFKPESSIHPSWGLPMTKYFISQSQ